MDLLSTDVILLIISKLSYKNIVSLCLIKKRYYRLLDNNLIWKNRILKYKCNIKDILSLRGQYLIAKAQSIKNENIKMRSSSQKKEKYLYYMQLGRKLIPIKTEYKYIDLVFDKVKRIKINDILNRFHKSKTEIFSCILELQEVLNLRFSYGNLIHIQYHVKKSILIYFYEFNYSLNMNYSKYKGKLDSYKLPSVLANAYTDDEICELYNNQFSFKHIERDPHLNKQREDEEYRRLFKRKLSFKEKHEYIELNLTQE